MVSKTSPFPLNSTLPLRSFTLRSLSHLSISPLLLSLTLIISRPHPLPLTALSRISHHLQFRPLKGVSFTLLLWNSPSIYAHVLRFIWYYNLFLFPWALYVSCFDTMESSSLETLCSLSLWGTMQPFTWTLCSSSPVFSRKRHYVVLLNSSYHIFLTD